MSCYHVGDSVVIRKDLVPETGYHSYDDTKDMGKCYFIAEMCEFLGLSAKITEVRQFGFGSRYSIDIDNHEFNWADQMFEPEDFGEFNPSDFSIGDFLFS